MKFPSVFLALVFASACSVKVGSPDGEGTKPGTERRFSPQTVDEVTNPTLKGKLKNLCDALEEKEQVLDDYEAERSVLGATYQETDCDGKASEITNHELMVTRDSGTYIFQNAKKNFPLTEIETTQSGVMKEICRNMATLQNPMLASPGSSTAIEFEPKNGISECPNNSQNTCLLIMRGRVSDTGDRYVISESALVSFETVRGGRVGFYSYKSVTAYGTCGGNKFRTKTVRFN